MTHRAASVAALAACLAAATPAAAGPTVVTGGVRGGEITGFAWDPTHATTVWAGVNGAGLFVSSNGGGAWTQILLPTIAAHVVNKVLPSKAAADLVFVCEGAPSTQAIWRSGNAAMSFAGVLPATSGSCTSIIDSTTSGQLYAGVQDASNAARLYKSVDAGKTWTELALDLPGVFVADIVKLASGRVVIGTRDGTGGARGANNTGSLYYSDDEGAHWTPGTGISTGAVAGIAFNGTSTLIALTTNGTTATLYTSADGAAWTSGFSIAAGAGGGQIAYHAASDTFFVMPTNDQLLQSAAAAPYAFGAAMDKAHDASTPVAFSISHHLAFAVDPGDAMANHLLLGEVAGGEGVLASAGGGDIWAASNDGLFAQQVDFAFKTPSGYRYAANSSGFVYFGGNSSLTTPWLRVYRPTDLNRDPVVAMTYDTTNEKSVVIAQSNLTDQALLRQLPDATVAPDEGSPFTHSSWTTLTYPDAAKSPVLALLVDGETMFAGVATSNSGAAGQYLYTSIDAGTSWTAVAQSFVGGVRALAFDPSNHQTLFAGAGDFKGDIRTVANAGGLWKSTDGGAHFTRVSTGNATLDGEAPRTILVDPADGTRVWVHADREDSTSGSDGDVFESLDGGATWTTITPQTPVFALTYSPAEGLLAVSSGGSDINVYVKVPGDGSDLWDPGFGVYGEAHVLYAGSIGAGTGSGLYEASGVMAIAGDLGFIDAGDVVDAMLPVDGVDGGGSTTTHGGCGCGLVPAAGAGAWAVLLVAVLLRLLFRRRAAPARPRA